MPQPEEVPFLVPLLKKTHWYELLKPITQTLSFKNLDHFLHHAYMQENVFPPVEYLFHALSLTDFDQVKVVILGQDPYHAEGQAHGLAFSVPRGIAIPPSLANIFKELHADLGIPSSISGDLSYWAKQGVLLINSVLTVKANQAHSHKHRGWEAFTDALIKEISQSKSDVVFILWGAPAQEKIKLIDSSKHLILQSSHPSPLSAYRTFFGSRPFSKANDYLVSHNHAPIDWRL